MNSSLTKTSTSRTEINEQTRFSYEFGSVSNDRKKLEKKTGGEEELFEEKTGSEELVCEEENGKWESGWGRMNGFRK